MFVYFAFKLEELFIVVLQQLLEADLREPNCIKDICEFISFFNIS